NTVDLRQQHFQKMLEKPKTVEQFDMSKDDDEMDDLRDGAIQTLSATMDDAEEHHEQQISQMSEDVRRHFLDDLHERARVATDWRKTKYDTPSEVQSMATAKSSDDELPPLEPLMTEDEAAKRLQAALKGRIVREETLQKKRTEKREQTMDNADSSSTVPQRQTRTHKETIDYSTDINHWKGSTVKEEDILFQLHLRGAGLTAEQEQQYSNTKKKGKGKKETGRTYLVGLVEKLINSGKWTTKVHDELLRKRTEDWRDTKGKGKATKD
ncbi:MAG: hypothetical protein NXI25_27125, partial [bacterium]|nr:hypothetical protein [bacterium]